MMQQDLLSMREFRRFPFNVQIGPMRVLPWEKILILHNPSRFGDRSYGGFVAARFTVLPVGRLFAFKPSFMLFCVGMGSKIPAANLGCLTV
jgi:hypothetical protein